MSDEKLVWVTVEGADARAMERLTESIEGVLEDTEYAVATTTNVDLLTRDDAREVLEWFAADHGESSDLDGPQTEGDNE